MDIKDTKVWREASFIFSSMRQSLTKSISISHLSQVVVLRIHQCPWTPNPSVTELVASGLRLYSTRNIIRMMRVRGKLVAYKTRRDGNDGWPKIWTCQLTKIFSLQRLSENVLLKFVNFLPAPFRVYVSWFNRTFRPFSSRSTVVFSIFLLFLFFTFWDTANYK